MPLDPGAKCNDKAEWVDGITTSKCPVKIIPECYVVFAAYNKSSCNTVLPYSGGFMEQPAALATAMSIIEEEAAKVRK